MKTLEVQLPDNVFDRLSIEAGLQGRYKRQVVTTALSEWLTGREYSRAVHGKQHRDGRCERAKR
jgi:hypothetical protein